MANGENAPNRRSVFEGLGGRGGFAFARGFRLRGEGFFRLGLAVMEGLRRSVVESIRGARTAFSRSGVWRHKYDGAFLVGRRSFENVVDERFQAFNSFCILSAIFSSESLWV